MPRHARFAPAIAAGILATLVVSDTAASEQFTVVSSRDTFVSLVAGRELRRFGITLTVTPDGNIRGRAFGTQVTGEWAWDDGFFCRDLFWGDENLGFNCQLVQVNGATVRFTSDQGTGQFADLTLR
jgi:hypothetical protein